MYIGVGLGVVVLALAAVLLIFFKYRNRDISSSLGKKTKHIFEGHAFSTAIDVLL